MAGLRKNLIMVEYPDPYVYVVGNNKDTMYHIYRIKKEHAISQGMVHYPTHDNARRTLLGKLEEQRIKVMTTLFELDKAIRHVKLLKSQHSHTLREDLTYALDVDNPVEPEQS